MGYILVIKNNLSKKFKRYGIRELIYEQTIFDYEHTKFCHVGQKYYHFLKNKTVNKIIRQKN